MFTRKVYNQIIEALDNYDVPLILLGARQVGKTTVLKQVANSYASSVYINFEENQSVAKLFEGDLNIDGIVSSLEVVTKQVITAETLIVLDEVQAVPRAITSLKYFAENGKYKVVATGSYLGVEMFTSTSSYPVGKVKELNMYPMSFSEYLNATGNQILDSRLMKQDFKSPIDPLIHQTSLQEFDVYTEIGGYPAVVAEYVERGMLAALEKRADLYNSIIRDFSKYADVNMTMRIKAVYDHIDSMLEQDNQKFRTSKVSKGGFREVQLPIRWLNSSRLVQVVYRVESAILPLRSHIKDNNFKLLLNDTGMFLEKAGYTVAGTLASDEKIYLGSVIESYIGNVLDQKYRTLMYYQKNTTEIDYIIQVDRDVIPIEVKAGLNTKAKSLGVYMKRYEPKLAIKVSRKNVGYSNRVLNIPLYLFDAFINGELKVGITDYLK